MLGTEALLLAEAFATSHGVNEVVGNIDIIRASDLFVSCDQEIKFNDTESFAKQAAEFRRQAVFITHHCHGFMFCFTES